MEILSERILNFPDGKRRKGWYIRDVYGVWGLKCGRYPVNNASDNFFIVMQEGLNLVVQQIPLLLFGRKF
jgi:hypothetical protein